MDRVIVYDLALPQATDVLNTNKNTMFGLAFLSRALLGGSTAVHGLSCSPTSPTASLNVVVGAGSIYALDETDESAYGDLGVDTSTILKQGLLTAPVTLTITPPSTSGYSQVFLVEAILEDEDTGSAVLSYYNPAIIGNPTAQPYAGPNNNGMSQYTMRQCLCNISLKAGVAATTGTQTTPSPDAGYTGLFAITVANGATQIVSGNIAQLTTAPFFPTVPSIPTDVQDCAWTYAADTSAGGAAQATSSGTATSSAVLHFSAVPSWVAAGMKAFDLTAPTAIVSSQTVLSTTGTTVTLSADVDAAVTTGDLIAFSNNAMVATISPVPTLTVGLDINIKAVGTNSNAATLNLNNLGAVAIHRANGAALSPGDIAAGMIVNLVYDGAAFQMKNFEGFTSSSTNNNTYNVGIPYGSDSGTANAVVVAPTPSIGSLSAGQALIVKIANTNTGATTLNASGLGAVAVVDRKRNAISAGDLSANQTGFFVYDGTYWQFLGFTASDFSSIVAGVTQRLTASLTSANSSVTFTADYVNVANALTGPAFTVSSLNATLNISTTGAGGMDTGSPPNTGWVSIYAIYNPSSGAVALLGTTFGQQTIYGGSNMPSGYTASALIAVWRTDSTGKLVAGSWIDRDFIYYSLTLVVSSGTAISATTVSLANLVPAVARAVSYMQSAEETSTVTANSGAFIYNQPGGGLQSTVSGSVLGAVIWGTGSCPLPVPQTIYYRVGQSTCLSTISIKGYRI